MNFCQIIKIHYTSPSCWDNRQDQVSAYKLHTVCFEIHWLCWKNFSLYRSLRRSINTSLKNIFHTDHSLLCSLLQSSSTNFLSFTIIPLAGAFLFLLLLLLSTLVGVVHQGLMSVPGWRVFKTQPTVFTCIQKPLSVSSLCLRFALIPTKTGGAWMSSSQL